MCDLTSDLTSDLLEASDAKPIMKALSALARCSHRWDDAPDFGALVVQARGQYDELTAALERIAWMEAQVKEALGLLREVEAWCRQLDSHEAQVFEARIRALLGWEGE